MSRAHTMSNFTPFSSITVTCRSTLSSVPYTAKHSQQSNTQPSILRGSPSNEYRLLGWVTITNGNVATTIHNLWFRLHSSDKGALTIAILYHDDSIINMFTLLSWWYIWRCNNLICSFSLILSQICMVDEIGCLSASCTPCCFISYCLQKKSTAL